MNQACAPSRGGCGTWFTVGATMCPNCQQLADKIGMLNMGALPAVGAKRLGQYFEQQLTVGEQGPEDVSDLVSVGAAQRSRKPGTNKPNSEKDTAE